MKKREILKLFDVGYRYSDAKEDEYVLRYISYQFATGTIYAIKGKSGSGKTTLLSLISGLEKRYVGNIYYNNQELKKIDLDKYRSHDIGIVFQSYNILPHLTTFENITLSMDINHSEIKDKKGKVLELLNSVGLRPELSERRILKLSGGEQQRVAIARSLSYNPKLIIADEPTGNLDVETENEIMQIFKRLAHEDDKCVIIVTHSDNVSNQCDKVYELKTKK